jgi:hypothetical protein
MKSILFILGIALRQFCFWILLNIFNWCYRRITEKPDKLQKPSITLNITYYADNSIHINNFYTQDKDAEKTDKR